jgi:hypothetical protein
MGQIQGTAARLRTELQGISPAFARAVDHLQRSCIRPLTAAVQDIRAERLSSAADRLKGLVTDSHVASLADSIAADAGGKLKRIGELLAYAGPVATALLGAVGLGVTVLAAESIMALGLVVGTVVALVLVVICVLLLLSGKEGIEQVAVRQAGLR